MNVLLRDRIVADLIDPDTDDARVVDLLEGVTRAIWHLRDLRREDPDLLFIVDAVAMIENAGRVWSSAAARMTLDDAFVHPSHRGLALLAGIAKRAQDDPGITIAFAAQMRSPELLAEVRQKAAAVPGIRQAHTFEMLDNGQWIRRDFGSLAHLLVAGPDDVSPAYTYYDPECGWCRIDAPHSIDAHNVRMARVEITPESLGVTQPS